VVKNHSITLTWFFYLGLMFFQAMLLRLKGDHLPWKSFKVIFRAIKAGFHGELGKVIDF